MGSIRTYGNEYKSAFKTFLSLLAWHEKSFGGQIVTDDEKNRIIIRKGWLATGQPSIFQHEWNLLREKSFIFLGEFQKKFLYYVLKSGLRYNEPLNLLNEKLE